MRQMKFINILIALIAGSLLSVKAQYSYEAVFMEVGDEKTIILPSSVTSKNIVESYWSNDSPTYVDIIKKSDYSVKIKILKYTSTSCMVQYDYYWGGSREHGNYSIRIDIKKPKKLELSASPSSGSISSGSKVYLATEVNGSTVSGADIYYTTNGTSPSKSSMKYTSSGVTITQNCTLKAIAYKDGYETSEVGSWSYTIASKPKLTLSANPAGGTVEKGSWVQLTASNDEAMIYYTTDGSNPKTSSTYSWPTSQGVQINESCTLKAYARLMSTGAESDVMTWTFTCKQSDVVVAEINATNFPDASFRNYLLEQDYGKDGKLTQSELDNITYLNVENKGINNLKGVEYFTALTSLRCSSNNLTSLDISKNVKLERLYCERNKLTSLNLSNNKDIFYVDMHYNKIQLSYMDAFVNSLPTNTSSVPHNLMLVNLHYNSDGNVCTKAQVANIKAKGWTPYCYISGPWIEYEGSDDTTSIKSVVAGDKEKDATIYNLSGQRLGKPRKGINIIGGKKVVVK